MRKKYIKWTKEEVLKFAKQYATKAEWIKNHRPSYEKARTSKWLEEASKHMIPLATPTGYWNAKTLKTHVAQFKTRTEWLQKSPGTYKFASENGLRDEVAGHMTFLWEKKWDDDKVIETAKQYQTIGDWRTAHSGAYMYAFRKGLLQQCTQHMKVLLWHGERMIKRVLIALQIDFIHQQRFANDPIVGRYFYDFFIPSIGLLIEYHGEQHRNGARGFRPESDQAAQGERDKEKKRFAKANGYVFLAITAWQHKTQDAIESALLNQLAKSGIKIPKKLRKLTKAEEDQAAAFHRWTKESLKESASGFTKLKDWRESNKGGYSAALRRGWLKEIAAHMSRAQKPNGYWDKTRCTVEAKKYNTKVAFEAGSNAAYQIARRNGWLPEIGKHFECGRIARWSNHPKRWTLEKCISSAQKHEHIIDWVMADKLAYSASKRNSWHAECTAHMKPKRHQHLTQQLV